MARKRVNKPLVAVLTFVVLGVALVASLFAIAGVKHRDPKTFVKLAKRYASDKDWETAARFYLLAWEKSGQHEPKYLVDLGQVRLAAGDINQALVAWRNALVADPMLVVAHHRQLALMLELAKLYGGADSWRHVREAAQAMLAVDTAKLSDADRAFADHAEGLAVVHVVPTTTGEIDPNAKSLRALREAVALAPDETSYTIDLAKGLIETGARAEGEALFEDLLTQHAEAGDTSAVVYSGIGQYYARPQSADENEQAYEARLQRAGTLFRQATTYALPNSDADYDANVALATYLGQQWLRRRAADKDTKATQKFFDQALATLTKCTHMAPSRFEAFYQLARLYKAARREKEVLATCEARLAEDYARKGVKGPRNKLFAFRLMLLASESCVTQALTVASSVEDAASQATNTNVPDQDAPPSPSPVPRAREQWLARAQAFVDRAEGEFPGHPRGLHQAGRILLARGNDRAALAKFRQADQAYSARGVVDWDNKILLAKLHLRLGEPGAAKEVLKGVLAQAKGTRAIPVWLLYAQSLLGNNEFNNPRIDQLLADVALRQPDNAELRRLQVALHAQRGDLSGAGALIDSPVVKLLMKARELAGAGDADGALRLLQSGLDKHPKNQQLVGTVVQELLRQKKIDAAGEVVQRALSLDPDNAFFKRLAVLTEPGLADAQREQDLLKLIEQTADPLQRSWELAEYYLRQHELARSIEYLSEVERHLIDKDTPMAQGASLSLHRSLLLAKLRIASQAGDDQAMEEARASAVRFDVDGAKGQFVTGLYYLYRKELDRAILAFRQAVAMQPTSSAALAYLGQSLHRSGQSDEAQDYYERAIRINPNDAVAQKGLAVLAKQRGDQAAFALHFSQCKRLSPSDPWVQTELVNEQERMDPAGAIVRRESLLKDHPSEVNNLTRLASLCEQVGDMDKASGYYRQLLQMKPNDRDIALSASRFYRRAGRENEAVSTLKRYAAGQPSNSKRADARILVAAYYLQRKELDTAQRELLDAADLAETFEVCFSLGEFYLRSRQNGSLALHWFDKAATLARAQKLPKLRQVLSARIAAMLHRSLDDVESARSAVEQFRQEFPDDGQGLLWDAEVQARSGNLAAAIDSLSRFLEKQPNNPAALLQRALHYTALGRMPQAVADLEAIKRADPLALKLEPRFLLANLYRRADRIDDWIGELEAITKDAPGSTAAVEQLTRAYVEQKRYSDADRIVTSQINQSAAAPDPRWLFLRGRVSLEVGDDNRALVDFRRGDELAGHTADSLAGVLEVFLRLQRWADGIAYYERFAKSAQPSARLLARQARLLAGAGKNAAAVQTFCDAMDLAMEAGGRAVSAVVADVSKAFPDPDQALVQFESDPARMASPRARERIRVRLYRLAGRVDDAKKLLNRLLETAADDRERADLGIELGELLQSQGDAQAARKAYEDALRHNDQSWIALNNLAYLLSDKLGLQEEALSYAKAAVKLADTADTLDTLGWVYVQLRQFKPAIAQLARSTRLNPNLALTYYHLGEAYRRSSQFIEAKDVFQRGSELESTQSGTDLAKQLDRSLVKTAARDATP